ncbi:hypothetical protein HMPREF1861_00406 [Corynebacterium kroppenstedtii]|nr:hypothetical protein HMPREF1861_00406 [Corynebacterium kroppenstedtii]
MRPRRIPGLASEISVGSGRRCDVGAGDEAGEAVWEWVTSLS